MYTLAGVEGGEPGERAVDGEHLEALLGLTRRRTLGAAPTATVITPLPRLAASLDRA